MIYRCQNCAFTTGDVHALSEVAHLSERVAPGERVPDGECPECGAACHADEPSRYYAVQTAPDRYDLRQSRFRAQLAAGRAHPHDVMAAGFTGDGLRALCGRYGFDADLSAIKGDAS